LLKVILNNLHNRFQNPDMIETSCTHMFCHV